MKKIEMSRRFKWISISTNKQGIAISALDTALWISFMQAVLLKTYKLISINQTKNTVLIQWAHISFKFFWTIQYNSLKFLLDLTRKLEQKPNFNE